MIEKHDEHGVDLHMLFIDFKLTFDSINRKILFEAMDKMRIPKKLIRLIRMTMSRTKARSAPFEFNKGVKQGERLSTTLFILALHNAAQEIDQRGTFYTKSSQISACADDLVIVTRSGNRLRQVYREIEKKTQQMGLKVNEKKTKYMIVSATQRG
jgi:hypothetical protein